ncbi:hypothetical protein KPA94_20615 [Burkholderia semiarida]|uniref:hypothetical protein n=1 Tax=Burkholderia semiarida TaxID=2843303 RepID=UPI0023DDF6A1|nr:hypothetical protein [Burkholderia semiarida]MDF3115831.1 hypothetical protein [Burkholderia semiarida]
MNKTLTAAQIAAAWRESGAVSATPPDWALRFARAIEREAIAARPGQPETRDAIVRSKRILALVDEYHESPTRDKRTALRVALMDEFQPEPRDKVTDDVQQEAMRWRALMKNGEPEVLVERTQRRVIQRTQPVVFSSPNLTGPDRFDTPSEMWVKRYVMFAWWARENEHRKFIEAIDAISAGEIQ